MIKLKNLLNELSPLAQKIAKEIAMGYEMFIEKGYQSPIKKNDIKGSDIRLMAKETMRYVKIPSIKNILK